MTYPYIQSSEKFTSFLKKLPDIGTPARFDVKLLKSLGFTSSNDLPFISVIKFIGLLDATGAPTALWKEMRANFGAGLAKGIVQGYSTLFAQYSDAHLRDDEALRTFFSAHSSLGAAAVGRMVLTFKAMCKLAKFDGVKASGAGTSSEDQVTEKLKEPPKPKPQSPSSLSGDGVMVNINIQLQVPADATGEVYEKFFLAMRKHLWPTE